MSHRIDAVHLFLEKHTGWSVFYPSSKPRATPPQVLVSKLATFQAACSAPSSLNFKGPKGLCSARLLSREGEEARQQPDCKWQKGPCSASAPQESRRRYHEQADHKRPTGPGSARPSSQEANEARERPDYKRPVGPSSASPSI